MHEGSTTTHVVVSASDSIDNIIFFLWSMVRLLTYQCPQQENSEKVFQYFYSPAICWCTIMDTVWFLILSLAMNQSLISMHRCFMENLGMYIFVHFFALVISAKASFTLDCGRHNRKHIVLRVVWAILTILD
jgi:hypothetical protein